MPLYEYVCEQDGSRIELMRPMSQADDPVEDPESRGRTFVRALSTFQAKGSDRPRSTSLPMGGGCGCGNPHGPCRN